MGVSSRRVACPPSLSSQHQPGARPSEKIHVPFPVARPGGRPQKRLICHLSPGTAGKRAPQGPRSENRGVPGSWPWPDHFGPGSPAGMSLFGCAAKKSVRTRSASFRQPAAAGPYRNRDNFSASASPCPSCPDASAGPTAPAPRFPPQPEPPAWDLTSRTSP